MNNLDNNVKKLNKYIIRIAKGDISALDGVHKDFGGLFFTYTKYYLYDESYAEDLLSEIYCKLVNKANLFKKGENGLNWIIKIIKNEAINHNIKYQKRSVSEFNDEVKDISIVFENIDFIEDKIDLYNALSTLSVTERQLLYYKYWQCYTIREISKLTGAPSSTIQYSIKTAIDKLNSLINKVQNEKK